jgi:sulfane dehydrogenase subunit SoxC
MTDEFPPIVSREELQLAARNHGMPLEALRYELTPVGLHYLLIHYDIPAVDPAEWHLEVSGLVERELTLTLDDLRARKATTMPATFECAGNGRAQLEPRVVSQPWLLEAVGTAEWTGVRLRELLEETGVSKDASEIVFTGLDRGVEGDIEQHYARSLPITEAMRDEVLLAYAINGQALPPQHGFPLRLLVPGWYGMTNVKWLRHITITDEPFDGYQQARGYRLRQTDEEVGEPITRMQPRALMVPPGIPDFLTRTRILDPAPVTLTGRAWSGWGEITRVELSTDGGRTWEDAKLGPAPGPWAWHGWSYDWTPSGPGSYELACRATDMHGNTQPDSPQENWNLGGYVNNAVHRVQVTVRDR